MFPRTHQPHRDSGSRHVFAIGNAIALGQRINGRYCSPNCRWSSFRHTEPAFVSQARTTSHRSSTDVGQDDRAPAKPDGLRRSESMRPHGIDTGKFERTSLFYRPLHRTGMFLAAGLDDARSPPEPDGWINLKKKSGQASFILRPFVTDQYRRAGSACPNGRSGLAQCGLALWRQTGREPVGAANSDNLTKRLFDAGLERRSSRSSSGGNWPLPTTRSNGKQEFLGLWKAFFADVQMMRTDNHPSSGGDTSYGRQVCHGPVQKQFSSVAPGFPCTALLYQRR